MATGGPQAHTEPELSAGHHLGASHVNSFACCSHWLCEADFDFTEESTGAQGSEQ